MVKAAGLFMNMDAMLGSDFERGLASLGPLAEAAGKDRLAREKASAAVPPVPPAIDPTGIVDLVPPTP